MFSSSLAAMPYGAQKAIKAKQRNVSFEILKPKLLQLGYDWMPTTLAQVYRLGTFKVVDGDNKDYRNFTYRLTDQVQNDVPKFELWIRNSMLGLERRPAALFQACVYTTGPHVYVSWAFAYSTIVAHHMLHRIGTEDVLNKGQQHPQVVFRRLPFKMLEPYHWDNTRSVFIQYGQLLY